MLLTTTDVYGKSGAYCCRQEQTAYDKHMGRSV